MNDNKKILVGKIVAFQGVRGDVRVQTFTEKPGDFAKFKVQSSKFNPDDFRFVRTVPNTNVIIAHIKGFNDRTSAEVLRGTELFIERDALPALTAGEYYQADLIGFTIMRDGEKVGTVSCFQDFGAGDIIEAHGGDAAGLFGLFGDGDAGEHVEFVEAADEFGAEEFFAGAAGVDAVGLHVAQFGNHFVDGVVATGAGEPEGAELGHFVFGEGDEFAVGGDDDDGFGFHRVVAEHFRDGGDEGGAAGFEFDEEFAAGAEAGERVGEGGEMFVGVIVAPGAGDVDAGEFREGGVGDGEHAVAHARGTRIVGDHDDAVGGEHDVALHAVGMAAAGKIEGGQRIFGGVDRLPAVRDPFHAHDLRLLLGAPALLPSGQKNWRRGPESNRSERFCRPLPNLLATTPRTLFRKNSGTDKLRYNITRDRAFVNRERENPGKKPSGARGRGGTAKSRTDDFAKNSGAGLTGSPERL